MENLKLVQNTFSMASYLFLRSIFGKEIYPESVVENLSWFVEALIEGPANKNFRGELKKELIEGEYIDGCESFTCVQNNLIYCYGLDENEAKKIISILETMDTSNRPLIVLIGRSGTGKTCAIRYLNDAYGWQSIDSYTTGPKRSEDEKGHTFVTDEEFDRIPKEEIMAYVEYCGYRYCATRSQLNDADLYVVDPDGYEYLKNKYHDRPIISIALTASRDTLEKRMKERGGCTDEAINYRLEQDDLIFKNLKTDITINTDQLSIAQVGETIVSATK